MKSGPKPLTPAVRLLRGSRKRPRHSAKAVGAVESPLQEARPSWSLERDSQEMLSVEARRVWQQVIRPLQLPQWQWQQAVQYCSSLVRWREALVALGKEGEILTHPNGVVYAHPLAKLVKELSKELLGLAQELGLDRAPAGGAVPRGGGRSIPPKQRFFPRDEGRQQAKG